MKWNSPSPNGFAPHPLLKLLLIAVIICSLAMALKSDFNRHPDEIHHFEAAKFYTTHYLTPVIGDPIVRKSYSVWGDSYLNHHWTEYFLAGKFMLLVSIFGGNPLTSARLFQIFLLICLSTLFIYRARERAQEFIFACFLLVSPQIWYIFGYINNDAFALIISLLIAYQVGYSKSYLNQFLQAEKFSEKVLGGILAGGLIGVMLTCKPNYWVFLVFIALWVLFNFPLNTRTLKRYVFVLVVAFLFLGFRIGLDLYVNRETNFVGLSYLNYFFGSYEHKQNKLRAYQEEVADPCCKPSTVRDNLMGSHPDLKLKSKGVKFSELFSVRRWHYYSFLSFVGVYAYMSIYAGPSYYQLMMFIYACFWLYLIGCIVGSRRWQGVRELLITVFSALLCIFISVYLSWSYAFQAQGRYLFPIIGMTGLLVYSNRKYFHNRVMHLFIMSAFLLSLYSFICVALAKINT